MNCPYCENEMEQGYVISNGARMLFSYQKTTLVYTPGEGEILLDKHHMGDDEKRSLEMDHYEHGVVLNALNEYRNDVLAEGRTTDLIDEVLLKAIDAPTKKEKRRKCRGEDR